MTLVQNYIGLDARISAIVKSLLNGESVDLSDYYTKAEVDALIASGGGGTTIDYNNLLNRPTINGLLQSNLDLNGKLLLYNSKQLYCPTITDNIITFDSDCVIPNIYNKSEVYTKAECDEKFSGGGGGGTTDYNQLSNRPIIDGLLQANLDLNNNSLLNHGKQLYCPTVTDDTITFDKDIQADNIKLKVNDNYISIADNLEVFPLNSRSGITKI